MISIFFSVVLLFTNCFCSSESKVRAGSSSLQDLEHHKKASQTHLNFDGTILKTGWYYVTDDTTTGHKRQLDKTTQIYYLTYPPIITAKNITSLEIYVGNGGKIFYGLSMRLDKEGTKYWSIATQNSIGLQLAFVLDNRLLQVADVMAQITGGVTALNRGIYSKQELEKFKTVIESEK